MVLNEQMVWLRQSDGTCFFCSKALVLRENATDLSDFTRIRSPSSGQDSKLAQAVSTPGQARAPGSGTRSALHGAFPVRDPTRARRRGQIRALTWSEMVVAT